MANETFVLSSELRFANKAEWLKFFEEYQKSKNHVFTSTNTKYLHQVKLKGNYNAHLDLYSADYKCHKHGIYESKGKGIKKSTSIKTNCLAAIRLRLTPCRQFLYIKSFHEQHNHPQMGILDDADDNTAEAAVSVPDKDVSNETAVSEQNNRINEPKSKDEDDGEFWPAGPLAITDDIEMNQVHTTGVHVPKDHQDMQLQSSPEVVEIEKEVRKLALANNSCRIVSLNAERRSHATASSSVSIADIILPKKVDTKGRPPGRATTAIGLPRKKTINPVNFDDKTPIQQVRTLLQLILPPDHLTNVIGGEYLIQDDDVSMDEVRIPDSFTHDSVNLNTFEIYFEKSAFKKFRKLITIKKKKQIFLCRTCQTELTAESSCVLCDSCLSWYHFECDTYDEKKSPMHWYCKYCIN